MEGHVRILGWFQIAVGILSLLGGAAMVVAMVVLASAASAARSEATQPFLLAQGLLGALAVLFVVCGLVGLAGGVGLMRHRAWARTVVIVLSFLYLLNIPLGTLLGVYGLWVLMSSEGERYYRQVATA